MLKSREISHTQSWRVWRRVTQNFRKVSDMVQLPVEQIDGAAMIAAYTRGGRICPWCMGKKNLVDEKYGPIYCLCHVLDFQTARGELLAPYRAPFDIAHDQFRPIDRMDPRNNPTLQFCISVMQAFIASPDTWVTISGGYGTGKSNMLMDAAQQLGPMALYMTAGHFEHLISSGMNDNSLNHTLEVLAHAPVLLYDDWGSEQVVKADGSFTFAETKLRYIIDFRYNNHLEYPTVVTTNFTPAEMLEKDARIGSRLRDTQRAKMVALTKLTDYRLLRDGRGR